MAATGLGFAGAVTFWPLLLIAVVGTLNPSSGDVSVFLPTEQALLADTTEPRDRTALFARFALAGALAGAFGALASGLPATVAAGHGWDLITLQRLGFLLYAGLALVNALIYRGLSRDRGGAGAAAGARTITLDRAAAVRFVQPGLLWRWVCGQSLLVLWLYGGSACRADDRVDLLRPRAVAGAVPVALTRDRAALRLINTMVFTHLPSNAFPARRVHANRLSRSLLLRTALSQMDVPARQSYVMAIVPPEERAAAASVTNVPRSLATALAPGPSGALLALSSFGWPLVLGGASRSSATCS
jgi:hypothetical protein